jgi:hypothetical protein
MLPVAMDGRGPIWLSPAGARAPRDENADWRVRAGMHFGVATVAGQKLGSDIGWWAVSHTLRPP